MYNLTYIDVTEVFIIEYHWFIQCEQLRLVVPRLQRLVPGRSEGEEFPSAHTLHPRYQRDHEGRAEKTTPLLETHRRVRGSVTPDQVVGGFSKGR